jgi:hypothetical protein
MSVSARKKTKPNKLDIIFDIDLTLVESIYVDSFNRAKIDSIVKDMDKDKYFFIKLPIRLPTSKKTKMSNQESNGNETKTKKSTNLSFNEFIVFIRPYAKLLLNWCFNNANVSFWTAGTTNYAITILKNLLTTTQFNKIRLILTRNAINGTFINLKTRQTYKPLNNAGFLVKNMDLLFSHSDFKKFRFAKSTTYLIDDLDVNYDINKNSENNFIHIKEWSFDDASDDELLKIKEQMDSKSKGRTK